VEGASHALMVSHPHDVAAFIEAAASLLTGHEVIIHGEYTPHNVLLDGSTIYAIDWESAAIGPGEIDVASLTDLWPDDLVKPAIAAYLSERWGDDVDPGFYDRLAIARIYWVLRWLGNRAEVTANTRNRARF